MVASTAVARRSKKAARKRARLRAARRAHIALQRFGLGPKPGVLARIARNPLRALEAELDTRGIATVRAAGLPGYVEAARQSTFGFDVADALFRRELDARVDKQMQVRIGFVERLVMFWSNHFSTSIDKSDAVRGMVGQLEREVIRKHVLGNFTDMLLGVMKHPSMVAFLDNAESIGPNSAAAQWWDHGYNENLAREVMELHTVGSGGGYSETDVTALAKILTGWSYVRGWEVDGGWNGGTEANRGQFIFRADWHEPGTIRFMGRDYPDTGINQGVRVLRRLAASPYTAENIAFKLIRHFIDDTPSPKMVRKLAKVFTRTKGNLKAVARALIRLPGALGGRLSNIRTPYELTIAQFRALGTRFTDDTYWAFWGTMDALYNQPWQCLSPEGYPDETAYWLSPDAMTIRMDTALLSAWIFGEHVEVPPVQLAKQLFGPALGAGSRRSIEKGWDKYRGYTALFMAPEFQRR